MTAEPRPEFAEEPSTLASLRDFAKKLFQVPKREIEEDRGGSRPDPDQ